MESTGKFGLPLMIAGQSQRELTHNEALLIIDMLMGCAVRSRVVVAPPPNLAAGDCWLVPDGGMGDWQGLDGLIAGWMGPAGWRTVAPQTGLAVWVEDEAREIRFDGGQWMPVAPFGTPAAAVAMPTAGTTIDAELRVAVTELVDRLKAVGIFA